MSDKNKKTEISGSAAAAAAAKDDDAKNLKIPPLLGSCRFVVALMAFGFMFHSFFFRYTFSTGIVCMVGTKQNTSEGKFAIEVTKIYTDFVL